MVLLCEASVHGLHPFPAYCSHHEEHEEHKENLRNVETDTCWIPFPRSDLKRILSFVPFVVEYPFCVLFNDLKYALR